MSARYAVDLVEAPSRSPRRASWVPRVEITGAVPVVRRAILARHKPQLTRRQTGRAGTLVKHAWPAWKDEYVAHMAHVAGVPPSDLLTPAHEVVRYRYDGETPMIDLPRIRTVDGCAYQYDQRNCCALCIDEFSSKVWTRVGPPEGHAGYGLHELRATAERYRQHAIEAGEWFYDEFFRLTAAAFEGTRRTRDTAVLEVTTVGLRVDGELTDAAYDAWLFDSDSANLANDELCKVLASAAGIDFDVDTLLEKEPEAYWLAVPTVLRARSGLLAPRRVLYLSRIAGNVMQFIGVGLDDSGSGDLANDVALKVSRLIAGWV